MEANTLTDRTHSRRGFLRRIAGAATGAGMMLRAGMWAHAADTSRLVIGRHSRVVTEDGDRDLRAMGELLDGCMTAWTGETDVVAAWRSIFEPTDVIGLKVNAVGGVGLTSHPVLCASIADRLQQAGVSAENIIIWDRSDGDLVRSGFTINRDGPGVKCYGTETDYGEKVEQGRWSGRLSRILTDQITALINVPLIKEHPICGVSVALKNHFGCFDVPWDFHDNHCDPFVADMNLLPVIREKQRIIIGDATVSGLEGGPTFQPQFIFAPKALLISTDPVAMDDRARVMVEAARAENGLPELEGGMRSLRGLATAAQKGLGTADAANIEVVEVEAG